MDFSKYDTIELDNLACRLSRDMSAIELGYTDFNGDWTCKKEKRKFRILETRRNLIDKELEKRGQN